MLQANPGRALPAVSSVTAGGHATGFLVRPGDELPEPRPQQLLERLQVGATGLLKPC